MNFDRNFHQLVICTAKYYTKLYKYIYIYIYQIKKKENLSVEMGIRKTDFRLKEKSRGNSIRVSSGKTGLKIRFAAGKR